MSWKLASSPPLWYCLFWACMFAAVLTGVYFVVKLAVLAALREWRP